MTAATRVYLPLLLTDLAEVQAAQQVGPSPVTAYAVTPRARAAEPEADEEELEYAALCDAVAAAGRRRADGTARRVVAAADVPASIVTETAGSVPSVVSVTHPVALRDLVSFHVDEAPGQDDDELLWYDVTELAELVALQA